MSLGECLEHEITGLCATVGGNAVQRYIHYNWEAKRRPPVYYQGTTDGYVGALQNFLRGALHYIVQNKSKAALFLQLS